MRQIEGYPIGIELILKAPTELIQIRKVAEMGWNVPDLASSNVGEDKDHVGLFEMNVDADRSQVLV